MTYRFRIKVPGAAYQSLLVNAVIELALIPREGDSVLLQFKRGREIAEAECRISAVLWFPLPSDIVGELTVEY